MNECNKPFTNFEDNFKYKDMSSKNFEYSHNYAELSLLSVCKPKQQVDVGENCVNSTN